MRGRKPEVLSIHSSDLSELERIARSDTSPWYQVRRARIVLGIAAGQRREVLATQLECDESTIWRTCQRYRNQRLSGLLADQRQGHSGRDLGITPVQRAQIVALGCLEPVARGLHITHWSSEDLARQAVLDGIVSAISPRTVRRILDDVDLQPHRTRYWRTARLDSQFKERAEKVLWCYANAQRLAKEGIWTVAVDEMPNLQVLERDPIRRAIPGSIEQQEFEYVRHGTVNLLNFLVVHTGRMEAAVVDRKDAAHYVSALRAFRRRHRRLKGVFLVHDGDPGHTAAATAAYPDSCGGWWRPRLTPAHASWLNQAELLNRAFAPRYLRRGSWDDRQAFIDHVLASAPEYNRLYAHPFEWMWTNQK